MNEKLIELYDELNSLELDLLGPIRISKTINNEAFNQFYLLLELLKELLKNEDCIPINLVGKLFNIYSAMMSESYHAKYPEPIFMETAKIESYLFEILRIIE